MVDGFRSKILHKKASLAVLSDEQHSSMFDADEQAAIADCIPWTRVVTGRRTVFRGESIDLLPWAAENREHLVLKPNDEYGGKGITLGWTVTRSEWESALVNAQESPHIVQERVAIPGELYPSWIDGSLEILERQYDTAPFVTNGAYMEGLLTRLSTAVLLNVTAGGGSTVPTFLVQAR